MQSKRKYLGDFVRLIGKKFADEYRREDVLKYKNKLQDEGFQPKTIDTRMMAVVTFFNRWLKIKLGLDAKDWLCSFQYLAPTKSGELESPPRISLSQP